MRSFDRSRRHMLSRRGRHLASVKQESGTSTTSGSRLFAMEDFCSILFITLSFSEVSNSALIFANACSSNSCFSLNVASNLASEEDVLTEGCLEAAFGVEVCASYMVWGVCLLYAAGSSCGLGTRIRCSRPPRWVNRCTGPCSFSAPTSIVRFVYWCVLCGCTSSAYIVMMWFSFGQAHRHSSAKLCLQVTYDRIHFYVGI